MFRRMNLSRRLAPSLFVLALGTGAAQAQFTEEVPFITSPDNVTLEMLRVAGVGPRDHVIDLGSGDGRIVITAAKRFGATGLGVEIVPELVEKSLRVAREAGVADKVSFKVQDLFETDLSPATVITMYLLPEFNLKLRPSILDLKPGTRIVSHDWDMGEWKPDQTTVVPVPDKKVGRDKSSRIHLWIVPARIEGLWCGTGPAAGQRLQWTQRFQEVQGTLAQGAATQPLQGRVRGSEVQTPQGSLQLTGDALHVSRGSGPLAAGAVFERAAQGRC